MNIAGNHTSLIAHLHGSSETFAAWGGAGIEHAHARLRAGDERRAVRGRVLHIKPSVGKSVRGRQIAAMAQQRVRKPRVRLCLDAVRAQGRHESIRRRFQGVHLQAGRCIGIVRRQRPLGKRIAMRVDIQLRQPPRVAVAHGKIVRRARARDLRQRVPVLRHAAQHRVDETGCTRAAALAAERDRLVHGSARRDFIQQHDLIGRQPQQVEHLRLELLQRRRAVDGKIMIQQGQILQRAVADARRKRGIARLQLCILQDGMERSVRPRAVFAPALQRSPGGFPGSHGHGQPSTGSVCPSR